MFRLVRAPCVLFYCRRAAIDAAWGLGHTEWVATGPSVAAPFDADAAMDTPLNRDAEHLRLLSTFIM